MSVYVHLWICPFVITYCSYLLPTKDFGFAFPVRHNRGIVKGRIGAAMICMKFIFQDCPMIMPSWTRWQTNSNGKHSSPKLIYPQFIFSFLEYELTTTVIMTANTDYEDKVWQTAVITIFKSSTEMDFVPNLLLSRKNEYLYHSRFHPTV